MDTVIFKDVFQHILFHISYEDFIAFKLTSKSYLSRIQALYNNTEYWNFCLVKAGYKITSDDPRGFFLRLDRRYEDLRDMKIYRQLKIVKLLDTKEKIKVIKNRIRIKGLPKNVIACSLLLDKEPIQDEKMILKCLSCGIPELRFLDVFERYPYYVLINLGMKKYLKKEFQNLSKEKPKIKVSINAAMLRQILLSKIGFSFLDTEGEFFNELLHQILASIKSVWKVMTSSNEFYQNIFYEKHRHRILKNCLRERFLIEYKEWIENSNSKIANEIKPFLAFLDGNEAKIPDALLQIEKYKMKPERVYINLPNYGIYLLKNGLVDEISLLDAMNFLESKFTYETFDLVVKLFLENKEDYHQEIFNFFTFVGNSDVFIQNFEYIAKRLKLSELPMENVFELLECHEKVIEIHIALIQYFKPSIEQYIDYIRPKIRDGKDNNSYYRFVLTNFGKDKLILLKDVIPDFEALNEIELQEDESCSSEYYSED